MNSKIAYALIAVIIIAAAAYLVGHRQSGSQQAAMVPLPQSQTAQTGSQQAQSAPTTAAPAGQAAVEPINTNVGSVAGVDLNSLGTEANQSASLAAQEGASNTQAIAGDGTAINSSTDSVTNPAQ